MVDVTDRMGPSSRKRPMVREGSGLSGSSSVAGLSTEQLRTILSEIEPLGLALSQGEVDELTQTTAKIIGDTNVEWTQRLNMLKTFRSLCSDSSHHTHLMTYLRQLGPPLQNAVKDLRCQLSSEACITVAHLAKQLGMKAEFLMEPMLPILFTLLVANAKVVSITGSATLMLVYESIPSFRLLPPLQFQMLSKSKEVRRAVCLCVKIVLLQWPPPTIQRHAHIINEVLKKGLTDADAEVRNESRECFPVFQRLFPGLASLILHSLEPLQKRQLMISLRASSPNLSGALATAPTAKTAANAPCHLKRLPSTASTIVISRCTAAATTTTASVTIAFPNGTGDHAPCKTNSGKLPSAASTADGKGNTAKPPNVFDGDAAEEKLCSICMENPKEVAFSCGHICCVTCSQTLNSCHMCRQSITQKIRLFF